MTALKGWLTIGMAVAIFTAGLIAVNTADAASKFKVLYQFNGDGVGPQGLIADRAGNLYGVTEQGGTFGDGTVFKLSPSSGGWNKTVLYNFQGPPTDIADPVDSLTMDAAGNLYGSSPYGGSGSCFGGCGGVFEVSPSGTGWTETLLHDFAGGTDGFDPGGGVIFDQQGNLYGTASSGGSTTDPGQATAQGLIFELTPAGDGTWTKNAIYTFVSSGVAPTFPRGRLTFDGSGNLYGLTFGGAGTVFKLTNTSTGWKHSTLYTFCSLANCADGATPQLGLTLRGGNLYGVTYTGGVGGGSCDGGCGVVYELSHSGGSWHHTVLYSFTGGLDGGQLYGVPAVDAAGNVYGSAFWGGDTNQGVVWEVSPSNGGWQETVLHSFHGYGDDGAFPSSSVILHNGIVFGGSPLNIFEIKP